MAVARNHVGDSSTQNQIVHTSRVPRPYKDAPTGRLIDVLEYQYGEDEPLDYQVVFELVDRLMVAEGIALPTTFIE